MYQITKTYSDSPIKGFDLDLNPIDIESKKVVDETYCGGKYWKRAAGFMMGVEDSGEYWWCLSSPNMGRFEYKILENIDNPLLLKVQLTDLISFTVEMHPEKPLYRYKDYYLNSIEDCIVLFYLDNVFTRLKDSDLTYTFGCRKFSNILIRLS